MKKSAVCVLLVILIAAGISSCKKIIRKIFQGIDADVPEFLITLPPIPFAPPYEVPFSRLSQPFNLDSVIKDNTGGVYGANDVSSVKVKDIVFNLTNADTLNNLSNFESVRVIFSSNAKADTVTIASITFPETYSSTTTYTPANSPDLKPYLTGSLLYYDVYGKMRRITTKSLQLSVKVTLRVE